jgi:hypothetical protein
MRRRAGTSLWADIWESRRDANLDPFVGLAAALCRDAAMDYHSFHNSGIRRRKVMGQAKTLKARLAIEKQIRTHAELAERWMTGALDWTPSDSQEVRAALAPYPFWLASEWLGWEPKTLADVLMSGRTGVHLYEQYNEHKR